MPDDPDLDALIRRAADRPVDEAALAARVLARVAAETTAGPKGLSDWLFALPVPRLVPAGFAAALALTPMAIATLPALDDPLETALIELATGDAGALTAGLSALGADE